MDQELRKPSSWLFSMGIASAAVGTRIMAAIEGGHALMGAGYYVAMWVSVTGTLLALIHGTHLLVLALALLPNVRDWWKRLRPPKSPAATKPALVLYQREVGGVVGTKPRTLLMDELRPARWSAWNDTALEVIGWYRVTGSLIYGVMTGKGKAFKDNDDANTVYSEMDRLGLVRLQNGRATVLADSLPSVLAAIRGGALAWTTESDPPPIAPAPLRVRSAPQVVISA